MAIRVADNTVKHVTVANSGHSVAKEHLEALLGVSLECFSNSETTSHFLEQELYETHRFY